MNHHSDKGGECGKVGGGEEVEWEEEEAEDEKKEKAYSCTLSVV